MLIATDRGGVFTSDDAGASFQASNDGFSERQIATVVADPKDAADLYAGVLNDKEFGGVFHAHNGRWSQMSEGLGGRDIFDLGWSRKGQLAAATNRGIFLYDARAGSWQPSRMAQMVKAGLGAQPRAAAVRARRGHGKRGKRVRGAPQTAAVTRAIFEGRASALAIGNRRWYAATDAGILHSDDEGASWSGGAVGTEKSFFSVSAHERMVVAASAHQVWYSPNYAQHWMLQPLPLEVTLIYSVTVTGEGAVWVATREGALHWIRRSLDEGSWEHVTNGLPAREVTSIREQDGWLLAAAAASNCWYVSRDRGKSWTASEPAEFEVSGAVMQGGTVYVTTRHHGVLVREPVAPAAALSQRNMGRASVAAR